jgi:hypothetical protein
VRLNPKRTCGVVLVMLTGKLTAFNGRLRLHSNTLKSMFHPQRLDCVLDAVKLCIIRCCDVLGAIRGYDCIFKNVSVRCKSGERCPLNGTLFRKQLRPEIRSGV